MKNSILITIQTWFCIFSVLLFTILGALSPNQHLKWLCIFICGFNLIDIRNNQINKEKDS